MVQYTNDSIDNALWNVEYNEKKSRVQIPPKPNKELVSSLDWHILMEGE